MSYIIGRGRYAREAYEVPKGSGGSAGPTGPVGPSIISVPTAAALTAHSVAGLVVGSLATITQRFSLYSYQPGDTTPADGWHIPAAGGGNWVYVGPTDATTQWNVFNWFVDPQNSTGLASDDNNGATTTTPLLTKNEIIRRWGTSSPTLSGDLAGDPNAITFLSGDAGVLDFAAFTPVLDQIPGASGGFMVIRGADSARTQVFTGTLLAVTPKDRATNQPLQSTFTVGSGAVAQGILLVNTTRGNSRAWAVRDPGAGNWILSQPLQPYAFPSFLVPVVEVDTWANGDSIVGFTLPHINISNVGAQPNGSTNATNSPFYLLYQCEIARGLFQMSGIGIILESRVTTPNNFLFTSKLGSNTQNAWLSPSLIASDAAGVNIVGGVVTSTDTANSSLGGSGRVTLSTDVIVTGLGGAYSLAIENAALEFVELDTGVTVHTTSFSQQQSLGSGASLYGAGELDSRQGTFKYIDGDLQIAQLQVGGSTTAYSQVTAAGTTTWHGGISVTPANLAAAAGAAGFGGLATVGAACITNGSTP